MAKIPTNKQSIIMKLLIYQIKIGNNTPKFYDICIESVSKYCKKYNIDHIVQTEPILKIIPKNSARSKEAVSRLGYLPIYEKENAFNYLDEYDAIAIIDSDVFIKDNSPNIFNELEDGKDFYGVLECDMPLTTAYYNKILNYSKAQYGQLNDINLQLNPRYGYEFYNMGVMVLSKKFKTYLNGDTPKQFIERKEFEKFVNGEGAWRWSTEQTMLNYWIRKINIPRKNIDWRWNALYKGIEDGKLNDANFIHFFLAANLPKKGEEIPDIIRSISK